MVSPSSSSANNSSFIKIIPNEVRGKIRSYAKNTHDNPHAPLETKHSLTVVFLERLIVDQYGGYSWVPHSSDSKERVENNGDYRCGNLYYNSKDPNIEVLEGPEKTQFYILKKGTLFGIVSRGPHRLESLMTKTYRAKCYDIKNDEIIDSFSKIFFLQSSNASPQQSENFFNGFTKKVLGNDAQNFESEVGRVEDVISGYGSKVDEDKVRTIISDILKLRSISKNSSKRARQETEIEQDQDLKRLRAITANNERIIAENERRIRELATNIISTDILQNCEKALEEKSKEDDCIDTLVNMQE